MHPRLCGVFSFGAIALVSACDSEHTDPSSPVGTVGTAAGPPIVFFIDWASATTTTPDCNDSGRISLHDI